MNILGPLYGVRGFVPIKLAYAVFSRLLKPTKLQELESLFGNGMDAWQLFRDEILSKVNSARIAAFFPNDEPSSVEKLVEDMSLYSCTHKGVNGIPLVLELRKKRKENQNHENTESKLDDLIISPGNLYDLLHKFTQKAKDGPETDTTIYLIPYEGEVPTKDKEKYNYFLTKLVHKYGSVTDLSIFDKDRRSRHIGNGVLHLLKYTDKDFDGVLEKEKVIPEDLTETALSNLVSLARSISKSDIKQAYSNLSEELKPYFRLMMEDYVGPLVSNLSYFPFGGIAVTSLPPFSGMPAICLTQIKIGEQDYLAATVRHTKYKDNLDVLNVVEEVLDVFYTGLGFVEDGRTNKDIGLAYKITTKETKTSVEHIYDFTTQS